MNTIDFTDVSEENLAAVSATRQEAEDLFRRWKKLETVLYQLANRPLPKKARPAKPKPAA